MIDPQSPTWRAVKAFCTEQIEMERNRLEETSRSAQQHDASRGAIAAYRALVAQDTSNRPEIIEGPDYNVKR